MYDPDGLGDKMSSLLTEIKDVMNKRNDRIGELRKEIEKIEDENRDLEDTVNELMRSML